MKIRTDFVTNSSSSSFIITNKTDSDLTLVDFVKETPQLLEEYRQIYYNDPIYSQDEMVRCAEERGSVFLANSSDEYVFGDDEDTLGGVYDYILRSGGESESFLWGNYKSYR